MDPASTDKWRTAGLWLLRVVAILLIAGTLLSTTDLNQWWIRIWDFPRVQILIAMVLAGLALWFFDRSWRPWMPLLLAGLSIWQVYRVYPYLPIADKEVAMVQASEVSGGECFTVLTLNVLQKNREYGRTSDLIRRIDPDVLLLTETDQPWVDAMAPVMQKYPNQIGRPLGNTYGIMFATRLPMNDESIQDLAEKDTPSVFATLMAGKRQFRMIGLHPRPPKVNQDTEERDAEIIIAAKHAREVKMPVLALGDFNDVAWSDTTSLFKRIGGFLDPRIGRGTYATFPADQTWLGWPLDHLFVTDEFVLRNMSVGEPVGSDHRPVLAELCLNPVSARKRNEDVEGPTAEDEADAEEVLGDYRVDETEDRVEASAD